MAFTESGMVVLAFSERVSFSPPEPVRPIEESGAMNGVRYSEIIEADFAQASDFRRAETGWRRGQRDGGRDNGVPARVDIDRDAFVEQALHVFPPFGMGRSEARMDRGAKDAAIVARRRRG